MADEVHDECGIAAVYIKKDGKESANRALFFLYKMMLNLQNRGQLSAGFTTFNPERLQLIDTYRNLGSVNEVFKTTNRDKSIRIFKKYAGNKGIGHVRYATCGLDDRSYAQPFERHHGRKWKWFSFCFNGNLVNYGSLKKHLTDKASYHLTRESDTEIIMHYLSKELQGIKKPELVKVFHNLSKKFDGCYNIAFINALGEIAVARDPHAFRPLVYGMQGKNVFVASESNALINCGVRKFQSIPAGHVLTVSNGKVRIQKFAESPRKSHCMFEWVYFSNVSSVINGRSVYLTRVKLGKELAKDEKEKITQDHIVVPVPDTARPAGDAFAFELGIPSLEGLIRNRFVGRTFIEGITREDRVTNKYTVVEKVLRGKKVFLVDDSIVRGATVRQLVKYIKEVGGAKEVHLRITCPPIMGPCFYGIDMSTIGELLVPAYTKQKIPKNGVSKEICKKIAKDLGADSLVYQSHEGLIRGISKPKKQLCMACLNGEYPTPCGKDMYKVALVNWKKGKKGRTYEGRCAF